VPPSLSRALWAAACWIRATTFASVGTKTLVREFDLHIDSDERAAEHWKSARGTAIAIRRPSGDEVVDKLHDQFFQIVLREGNKLSPTAHLSHHDADRDIGNGEIWSCSVMVPPSVIAALEADLIAGRADTISVGIKWSVTLVANEYAPVSSPNIWGIFPRNSGFLGEGLVGHLSGLWWRHLTLGPITPPQMQVQAPPPVEPDKRKRGWP